MQLDCRVEPHHAFAALFAWYASVSIAWSPGNQLWSALLLSSFIISFSVGALIADLRKVWIVYCALLTALIASIFIDNPINAAGNPNYVACMAALGLAAAIVYRLWWFVPVAIIGLVYLQSRGGIMAAGVIGFVVLWRHSRFSALALVLLTVPVLIELKPGDYMPVAARLGVWQDTLNHLTVFGSGFGSFFESYMTWPRHTNMTLARPLHAYNDVLELIFDLGIGVIPLWIAIILIVARSRSNDRLVVAAFAACGLTFFPLFIIPVGQLFFMTLGQLTKEPSNEMATRRGPSYRRSGAGGWNSYRG